MHVMLSWVKRMNEGDNKRGDSKAPISERFEMWLLLWPVRDVFILGSLTGFLVGALTIMGIAWYFGIA